MKYKRTPNCKTTIKDERTPYFKRTLNFQKNPNFKGTQIAKEPQILIEQQFFEEIQITNE
jgi:hypothetical protein